MLMDSPVRSLSPVERLQLVNQFRLLERLDADRAHEYREKLEIVGKGYSMQYEEVFREIHDEIKYEECQEVIAILNFHRILIQSYDRLDDKGDLARDCVRFRGFDAIQDSKRRAFAEHLRRQGFFKDVFAERLDGDSGMTVEHYRGMIARYNAIQGEPSSSVMGGFELGPDQIRQVTAQ